MVLPAKSVICMRSHVATFSMEDTTTIIALAIFLAGLAMLLFVCFSASIPGKSDTNSFNKILNLLGKTSRKIFSWKIFLISKSIVFDVLLQRRLYRRSRARWLIHSLIFVPFVFRFSWWIVALAASVWKPEWPAIWFMLDKSHSATAFLFDLTGIIIITGIPLACTRGVLKGSVQLRGLPGQDRLALGLVAGIVVVGFILAGTPIAMTAWRDEAEYAVAGYLISMLFSDSNLLA